MQRLTSVKQMRDKTVAYCVFDIFRDICGSIMLIVFSDGAYIAFGPDRDDWGVTGVFDGPIPEDMFVEDSV